MREQERNYHLIERVIRGLDRFQADRGEGDLTSLSQEPELQSLWEIVRFMDEMPGGFLIYRAGGREEIVYANQALIRMFQCESRAEFYELTGGSFRGMIHPDDLEGVESSIRRQVEASRYDLDYVEYRIVRKDGEIRWIEDYGHFIRSPQAGDLFYVFLGDATEKHGRLLTERALLLDEKEKAIRTLTEAYDKERAIINQEYLRRLEVIQGLSVNYESILYVDMDEDLVLPYRLSSRTEPMFRRPTQIRRFSRYTREYVSRWVHPEDKERVAKETHPAYIRRTLSAGQTYYLNYRVNCNGECQYLQLRLANVGDKERASQLVLGYRRVDEEIQREMEQKAALESALEQANLATLARDTFLSNMSHDMRTPLNAIFGFAELAKRNLANPAAAKRYLERVEASSRQLLDLIDKVLELSWSESQEARIEEPFDLCGALQEVYDFLKPQAEEKELDFSLDLSGVAHRDVCGDGKQIYRLALYLANNAVTYTNAGGTVAMKVLEGEAQPNRRAAYRLVVADTGVGISPDFLEKLFEPFSREKNTTFSGIHGVGLGLTIVKSIVDSLGGTIDVKSAPGEGSTFTVTLRLRHQTPAEEDGEDAGAETLEGCRLLLVEDNEINREIETEILEAAGFLVESAEDGSVAVEMLKAAPAGAFGLILMDIQMPVMDGWQATQAIRQAGDVWYAGLPIVALSANVFESDIQKSLDCGMNAHLAKPLDLPLLLKTIRSLVKGK